MFYLLFFSQLLSLESQIAKLRPETREKTKTVVAAAVKEFAPHAGFSSEEDQRLILAVIMKESAFIQPTKAGEAGEWGMMQVIPGDPHVREAATKYKCSADDQSLQARMERLPNGIEVWHKVCSDETPNIFSNGKVSTWKLGILLKRSVRAGIAIGIWEMEFWRKEYERCLKERYWTSPRFVPANFVWWWKKVKDGLGEHAWIVHYNHGGRLRFGKGALSYPLTLIKYISTMEN